MKGGITNTVAEAIQYDYAGGPASKPIIKTEYYSDTSSTWVELEDTENRSISLSNENKRYLSYSFMPPSRKLNLTLNNFEQLYSTGSEDPKASILKKNLLIRCWSGYELTTSTTSTASDDFSTSAKFVHTQLTGGKVKLDISSYSGTVATAALLGGASLGTVSYGTMAYGYPGYYTKAISATTTEDTKISRFDITTSSNKFSFRYRTSTGNPAGQPWSTFQTLATGTNQISLLTAPGEDNFEYIARFNSSTWNATDYISTAILYSETDSEQLFKQGTFIIDDPKLDNAKVQITGRDYLRKALETEINLPEFSNINVATGITKVLDRCNIPYDTATWDMTATSISFVSGTVAESYSNQSGWRMLDYMMDALNAGNNDWRFNFNSDGNPELKEIPTDAEADTTFHYFYNIENISKGLDSDKQLQRITSLNKDIGVGTELTMKSYTEPVSSATTGLHLTFGFGTDSTAPRQGAMFVRYLDPNNIINSETARSNTSIDFNIETGRSFTIYIYGCRPKANDTSAIWEELGNSNNILSNDGSTYRNINPFFTSAMASAYNSYLISLNGNPKNRIQLMMNPNPLLELNDSSLVFDQYTYTDDLYNIDTINESWTNPGLKQTYVLRDKGINLGQFIWDRNGYTIGLNDLLYDTGLVWDQDLGPTAESDSTDYSNTKEIQFS